MTRPPPSLRLLCRPTIPLASLFSTGCRSLLPKPTTLSYSTSSSSSSSPSSSSSTASSTSTWPSPITAAQYIVNPPRTTRPPQLDLPARAADSSRLSHLVATGRAYARFYKAGLLSIRTNHRLNRAVQAQPRPARGQQPAAPPSPRDVAVPPQTAWIDSVPVPARGTRAAVLLRQRLGHDLSRLPLFALLVAVCGEFTPLVVMLLPRLVPLPCRIPRQVDKLDRLAEARRAASFARRGPAATADDAHIARSLGLVSNLWDRVGLPAIVAQRRVGLRLAFLAADDAALAAAGGVQALEPAELCTACKDRGLDTLGVGQAELRDLLARWLGLVAGCDRDNALARMRVLLCNRPSQWPQSF